MEDDVEPAALRGRALLEARVPDRVNDPHPVAYSRVRWPSSCEELAKAVVVSRKGVHAWQSSQVHVPELGLPLSLKRLPTAACS